MDNGQPATTDTYSSYTNLAACANNVPLLLAAYTTTFGAIIGPLCCAPCLWLHCCWWACASLLPAKHRRAPWFGDVTLLICQWRQSVVHREGIHAETGVVQVAKSATALCDQMGQRC